MHVNFSDRSFDVTTSASVFKPQGSSVNQFMGQCPNVSGSWNVMQEDWWVVAASGCSMLSYISCDIILRAMLSEGSS